MNSYYTIAEQIIKNSRPRQSAYTKRSCQRLINL